MSLRKSYEIVIEHELKNLKDDGEYLSPYLTDEKLNDLVLSLSDHEGFHKALTHAVRTFIEQFGKNFGL